MNSASSDRRWLVLGICCMSLLIVGLDTTIVNVALPAIHRSLHASLAGLQWIIDAYTLVLGSLLMLGGSTELLFASYVMVGIGLGLINPPITNTAISGMPPAQAGWRQRSPRPAGRPAARSALPCPARSSAPARV